ncbi:MAG: thiamine pyrophosphate-dependent enzyme [Hyphomicrobium sp.]
MPNDRIALAHDALLEAETADDLAAYRTMLLIRRFEEKLGLLVALGIVSETAALGTGKEAVAVAVGATRRSGEELVSATATYGVQLAAGHAPHDILNRLMTGQHYDQGVGGVWHCTGAEASLDKAAERASDGVATLCWFSAQPRDEARLAETIIRMAAERLPVICLAEFQSDTLDEPGRGHPLLSSIERHGLRVVGVDGLDARRMRAACEDAWTAVRSDGGPVVVAATTVRFQGHIAAQCRPTGSKDRPREDTDPVARARARLIACALASDGELKAIDRAVREEVNRAAAAAKILCQPAD